MKRLNGKAALITGAAQGIGAAIAYDLLCNGAIVYVTDINEKKGREWAYLLGDAARFLYLDVRVETQWINTLNEIRAEVPELNIIVNNAGVTGYHTPMGPQNPEDISIESWLAVHDTNLNGTFLGCKHGIAAMKNNIGHSTIINISSRSGIVGIPGAVAYASSKAAIRNHTKSVALYCAEKKYPITCNSVHPAAIRTPMWEEMMSTGLNAEEQFRKMAEHIPLKCFGTPEDIAHAVVYLASDEAKYITGAELNIDGGILAGSVAPPPN